MWGTRLVNARILKKLRGKRLDDCGTAILCRVRHHLQFPFDWTQTWCQALVQNVCHVFVGRRGGSRLLALTLHSASTSDPANVVWLSAKLRLVRLRKFQIIGWLLG